MHASNGPIAESVDQSTDPVELLLVALKNKRSDDAVVRLLDAIARNAVPAGAVQACFRQRNAADLIPDMVNALAWFACPHCKRIQQHIIEITVTEAWLEPKRAVKGHEKPVAYDIHDGRMIPKQG